MHDRRDAVAQAKASRQVKPRRPADLRIARAVGCGVLHQLGGDAAQGLGVLHQRDGKVEGAEEFGLVARPGRRRQSRADGGQVQPVVEAALACQGEGRFGPYRAVQVQVKLSLRHPAQQCVDLVGSRDESRGDLGGGLGVASELASAAASLACSIVRW